MQKRPERKILTAAASAQVFQFGGRSGEGVTRFVFRAVSGVRGSPNLVRYLEVPLRHTRSMPYERPIHRTNFVFQLLRIGPVM
jgi:hypothetical protein